MKNWKFGIGALALVLVFLFSFLLQSTPVLGSPSEFPGGGNSNPFGLNDEQPPMILENESKYNFDETVAMFEQNVKAAGWSVVGVYDYKQILADKGYDILNIKIFALCSGQYSASILQHDDARIVSPLMPCTISIYEKSDGNTYIAQLNSGVMAEPFGGVIAEVMQAVAIDTEAIVANLIK